MNDDVKKVYSGEVLKILPANDIKAYISKYRGLEHLVSFFK